MKELKPIPEHVYTTISKRELEGEGPFVADFKWGKKAFFQSPQDYRLQNFLPGEVVIKVLTERLNLQFADGLEGVWIGPEQFLKEDIVETISSTNL